MAFKQGDAAKAADLVHRIGRHRNLRPYHMAFLGQAYVAQGKRDAARHSFVEARKMASDADSLDDQYVREYCRVYLTLMDTSDSVEGLVRDAMRIQCRPALKRWLPLTPRRS